MARLWEIRGLFGNEFAMEEAIRELKEHDGFEWTVLDRRNLSVRFAKRDPVKEGIVKRMFEIHHGFVESEAPLGEYDERRESAKRDKLKREEKKKLKAH